MDVDKLIDMRIRLDDRIGEKSKELKSLIKSDKESLTKIDGLLMLKLNESKADSLKTKFGTAFKDLKESFTITDRTTFTEWVKKTDNWHFFTNALSKTDAKKYREDSGELPPGINYSSFPTIKVRRATKKVS